DDFTYAIMPAGGPARGVLHSDMSDLRVVLDTNVFIGAIKGAGAEAGGLNRQVLRLGFRCALTPLMGAAHFAEHESLLARPGLCEECRLDAHERDELFNGYLAICRWVPVYSLWRPNLRDEADNHVVELAAAGGTAIIVTDNTRDFIGDHMDFLGITPLAPTEFLEEPER
ncbi:MAG: PIN domain-containing protein, partial [Rhodospirillales bacterium]